ACWEAAFQGLGVSFLPGGKRQVVHDSTVRPAGGRRGRRGAWSPPPCAGSPAPRVRDHAHEFVTQSCRGPGECPATEAVRAAGSAAVHPEGLTLLAGHPATSRGLTPSKLAGHPGGGYASPHE